MKVPGNHLPGGIISSCKDTDNNAYHNSFFRIKITDMLTVVTHKVENENLHCLLFVPQQSTTTTTSQLDIGHH